MKNNKYIGLFESAEGHNYQLEVMCNGFIQAFFLLTADAIRSAQHYQLKTITNKNNVIVEVDDILNCSKLLSFKK